MGNNGVGQRLLAALIQQHLKSFEKPSILFKVKEDENFNRRNTYSISRIKI